MFLSSCHCLLQRVFLIVHRHPTSTHIVHIKWLFCVCCTFFWTLSSSWLEQALPPVPLSEVARKRTIIISTLCNLKSFVILHNSLLLTSLYVQNAGNEGSLILLNDWLASWSYLLNCSFLILVTHRTHLLIRALSDRLGLHCNVANVNWIKSLNEHNS